STSARAAKTDGEERVANDLAHVLGRVRGGDAAVEQAPGVGDGDELLALEGDEDTGRGQGRREVRVRARVA
ncbi:MAG TPA: hypothetical protein VLT33_51310, partial [Labilithrix sp.]|nr:hypothetical protein [Labilithrix sp.]